MYLGWHKKLGNGKPVLRLLVEGVMGEERKRVRRIPRGNRMGRIQKEFLITFGKKK